MRLIGLGQRAIEIACQRAVSRVAFGKPLAEQGSIREGIATLATSSNKRGCSPCARRTAWIAPATRRRAI